MFSCDDSFKNTNVEDNLGDRLDANIKIDTLDKEFNIDEVIKAISKLNMGKSSGIDNLIPEIFIDGKEILAPILLKYFNFIYDKGLYPSSWSKGCIVPVPKKGDKNDVNNYRGINLTSTFSKIFSLMLDNRLRTWFESNKILSDFQFGFRKQRSTVDCMFVLNMLINRVLNQEKRNVLCFCSFQKGI